MYLLTRPVPKLHASVAAFSDAGLDAVGIAPIDILPADNADSIVQAVLGNPDIDALIVTSTFAAAQLCQHFTPGFKGLVVAVGEGTAMLLHQCFAEVILPEQHNSEGILAIPALLDANCQHVVIIKGEGGRTAIKEGLREAGKTVEERDVYHRVTVLPPVQTKAWQWQDVQGIVATSGEIATQLFSYYDKHNLTHVPWLTVSERIADMLRQRGVTSVAVCEGATDGALTTWIKQHWE